MPRVSAPAVLVECAPARARTLPPLQSAVGILRPGPIRYRYVATYRCVSRIACRITLASRPGAFPEVIESRCGRADHSRRLRELTGVEPTALPASVPEVTETDYELSDVQRRIHAQAIRRWVDESVPASRDVNLVYRGAYRVLRVNEIVPYVAVRLPKRTPKSARGGTANGVVHSVFFSVDPQVKRVLGVLRSARRQTDLETQMSSGCLGRPIPSSGYLAAKLAAVPKLAAAQHAWNRALSERPLSMSGLERQLLAAARGESVRLDAGPGVRLRLPLRVEFRVGRERLRAPLAVAPDALLNGPYEFARSFGDGQVELNVRLSVAATSGGPLRDVKLVVRMRDGAAEHRTELTGTADVVQFGNTPVVSRIQFEQTEGPSRLLVRSEGKSGAYFLISRHPIFVEASEP